MCGGKDDFSHIIVSASRGHYGFVSVGNDFAQRSVERTELPTARDRGVPLPPCEAAVLGSLVRTTSLVLPLSFRQSFWNLLGFPVTSAIKACFVNEGTFGPHLRMGAGYPGWGAARRLGI